MTIATVPDILAMNPRYANYARAHSRTPDEQLEADRLAWPGGCMVGYVLWNTDRIREAARQIPVAFYMGTLHDHAAYDAWLDERVDSMLMVAAVADFTENMDSDELDELERESIQ